MLIKKLDEMTIKRPNQMINVNKEIKLNDK